MNDRDYQAITTIALIAALADGRRQAEENEELNRLADAMGGGDYGPRARRVLAGQLRLAEVTKDLTTDASRRAAFETALVVVHADGVANDKEKAFLEELRSVLAIGESDARELARDAEALAAAPPSGPSLEPAPAQPRPAGPRPSQAGLAVPGPDAELDDLILKTAIVAAALELLPQNLATLAIVPMQARMVYRIGADYGQQLDSAQITDLAGAMGIAVAGQVFEGTVRKVMGGFAKGLLGRAGSGVAQAATGAAVTFAATYALGHAARQYYAQGRSLSRDDLRALFGRLKDEAAGLYPRVEASVREQAQSLRLGDVLARIRSA